MEKAKIRNLLYDKLKNDEKPLIEWSRVNPLGV